MATAAQQPPPGDDPGMAWGHPARVFDLAFSPLSADVIASGAEDGTARVWRRSAEDPHLWKQTVCCYGGHAGSEVLRVAWHPSGRLLATGGAEGAVRLWRADGAADEPSTASSSSSAAVTYAPPIDPLASEHPEEIYTMIFASRGGAGGGGGAAAPSGTGRGDGAGVDVSGGELLLTASAEALYLWDVETGQLLQGSPAPEARMLVTRAERVPMPPWRGPRMGRDGGGKGEGEGEDGGGKEEDEGDNNDNDDQPPPNYPKEMPAYVFGMAQVGGGAPPAPALLAAGCCDGTLRLWAFQSSAARLQPLFGAHAHAPGDMASFVHVLNTQAEDNPAGGGSGAAGAGGPYVVSVSRGGQATVFDARRLVAAGATAGTMTAREALSAGVVQRHWLDGPTMGGTAVAAGGAGRSGGTGGRRPLMLATVGADGRTRCYEARALLLPPPPPPASGRGEEDEGGGGGGDDGGPPVLRPSRILRCPGPALQAPLLAAAASADGSALAAAGFAVEAGALSREEQRLRRMRGGGGGEGGASAAAAAPRSVRRGGAAGAAVAGGRRRRGGGRPGVGTAVVLGGAGGGEDEAGGDDDDGSGLFATLTIGTAAAGGGAKEGGEDGEGERGGGGDGDGEGENDDDGPPRPPPKCEAESVSARAAVFVWRLDDD